MITKWHAHNYQSHQNTVVPLTPGVNAIVGSSDKGKSALLRNLLWPLTGNFGGDSKASNWIKDDKKKITKDQSMWAEITLGDGTVITRNRHRDGEHWEMGDQMYTAMAGKIPDPIAAVFNIQSVNVQLQMDAPFFLSMTAGERAKYLNQTVNLESMDAAVADIDSRRRKLSGQLKDVVQQHTEAVTLRDTYEWIDAAAREIAALESIGTRIEATKDFWIGAARIAREIESIDTMDWLDGIDNAYRKVEGAWALHDDAELDLSRLTDLVWQINQIPVDNTDWSRAEAMVNEFMAIREEATTLRESFCRVETLVQDIQGIVIDDTDWSGALQAVEEIDSLRAQADELRNAAGAIQNHLMNIGHDEEKLMTIDSSMAAAEEELHAMLEAGEVCPTCHRPL